MVFLARWFGKRPTLSDRVWLTEERKLDDLAEQVAADSSEGDITSLVIYHFSTTGERVQERFDRIGLDYRELRRPGTETIETLPAWVGAATAAVLASDEIPEEIKRAMSRRRVPDGQMPVRVHLTEHFPIPYRDDHVLNLAMFLPPGSTFTGYVGLDEPWLGKFLGSSTRDLMEQLGASDAEPLNHAMITSALRRAQKQLDKTRRYLEQAARSSQEWMELNLS